jgi:hypothetical protein
MHTPKPDDSFAPPAHPRFWLAMVRDILGINYRANLFGVNGRDSLKNVINELEGIRANRMNPGVVEEQPLYP